MKYSCLARLLLLSSREQEVDLQFLSKYKVIYYKVIRLAQDYRGHRTTKDIGLHRTKGKGKKKRKTITNNVAAGGRCNTVVAGHKLFLKPGRKVAVELNVFCGGYLHPFHKPSRKCINNVFTVHCSSIPQTFMKIFKICLHPFHKLLRKYLKFIFSYCSNQASVLYASLCRVRLAVQLPDGSRPS